MRTNPLRDRAQTNPRRGSHPRLSPPIPLATVMKTKLLVLVVSTLAFAAAHASSVIDSFDDVGGATNGLVLWNLNNTGIGGVGFTSKYEQTGSGVPVLRTNDLSVSLVNYVSGQNSFTQHWSVSSVITSSGLARRTQTRSTPSMSGTIWFSFLAALLTTNGDMALTFNGGFSSGGSGTPSANSGGLRVGLGSYTNATFRGALGVGPLTTASSTVPAAEITNIVNGVNGAVTAAGFVPTNGTPGLVLGRIDYDPVSFYPRVSIWYNPDVANEASLPAPTLTFSDSSYAIVPTTVTRIGYQVNRSPSPAKQNEVIDNVKVSDEPNGFDIVYKNAPLPTPVVNVAATVAVGSEAGPTNLVFTLTTDKPLAAPLTIYYSLGGVATNGYDGMGGFTNADYVDPNFDPGTLSSSVTIPQGQSNATVVLRVLDDSLPEGNESVIFTLQPSPLLSYLVGGSATATGIILDNNDAQVSLQYMFTRTPDPQVWDTNMVAAPAVTTGIGNGTYSGAYFVSPDASYSAGGNNTANTEDGAVANGDYMGILIAPVAGQALTLTNFEFQAVYGNYLNQVPGATGAVVFVRSSLDNFTSDLATFVLLPDNVVYPNIWYSNFVALGPEFSNLPGQVELRLYIYDDSDNNQVGVRIDNLYFRGSTTPLQAGVSQVSVSTNVVNAAEPATPGQFTINRLGDTAASLTVNYTISGTASNGVDYIFLPGTVTIPAGESNAVVTVMPIDDDIPEPTETVVLTLASGAGYGVLSSRSATVNLADDGDIGGLVAYFFNENNNGAGSLAAVAAPTINLTNQIAALNVSAGSGLGAFGAFNAGGYHGYGSSVYHSAPSSLYIGNSVLGTNAATALAGNDYLSFSLAGKPGYALTLTNWNAWLMMRPDGGQTNWVFLRSSLDNFATDLGAFTVLGTTNNSSAPFVQWTAPLNITNHPGAIEFRVYVYSSRSGAGDIFRMDDVTLQGSVTAQPPGSQVVNVVASDPTAAEPGTDTGAFTLSRAGDANAPLTVNYAITGTASNGVDYLYLAGTTNFDVGVSNIVIPVVPIDDNRPEPTETVVLTVLPSPDFYLGLTNTATVTIADDGDTTPLFTFAVSDTNAYERVSSLTGSFTLNRVLGDMTTNMTINFTLGGTAVLGVDYLSSATNSVTFGPGVTSQSIVITPIDNTLADGDRTVVMTVQTTPDFILDPPTSGTVTIVDDETPPGTVLWSDNFDAGTSAANYSVKAGSDLGVDDYVADFAFDYSTIGLPPAPGSTNTIGLMLNANALGGAAGVNFYPIGQSFSNDFALRFNLYLSMDPAAGADNEAAFFGINQTGSATNWISSYNVGNVYTNYGEGIWAAVATRDGTPGVATLRAATNSGTAPLLVGSTGNFPDLFNSPPYGQLGRPNNAYTSTNKTWVDCELSQLSGVISLKLNNTVVLQYTNATPFTSGNIFIGYGDPFASLGSANCFAIFDNVRVVQLAAAPVLPRITGINVTAGGVEILFTAGTGDAASAFKLQGAAVVTGDYADDNGAQITALGAGQFKATTTAVGGTHFYRIRR